ncbi:non-specific lipid transfer protein GPI-anchored 12 [Mangifera indica]|uniref:non-specific lipid transfer protein GPI-anchored 12 n=1 Tax=Mangifera indica TaxID=29780 RepID=UPI001CFA5E23|nr:non-specific lipid transfer protein GPI-anchored 12 [Mangifera indica]
MGTLRSFSTMLMMAALLMALVSFSAAQAPAPEPSSSAAFSPSAIPMGPSAMGPSPSNDCLNQLLNMSDCLSYVTAGSNVTVPDKPCCPELAGLVDSNPICLCTLLGQSSSFGINIDLKRALKLPSVCNVTTPPVSLCSAVGVGVPSLSPSAGPVPGLAASPSSGDNKSGASSMEGYVLGVVVGLLFAILI